MVYIQSHLKKYPLMQIQDILKLLMQGMLGPTHLIQDVNKLKDNLLNEYNQCKDNNINYDLIEEISDEYIRVYIKPYYEKYNNFDKLVDLFVKSCNLSYSLDEYKNEVIKLINDDNKEFISQYLNGNSYVISHSLIYKENYQPHYLLISKKYKGDI